ncbi:Mechanosensitive ion channel protein 10 [Chlorella vulgaris]
MSLPCLAVLLHSLQTQLRQCLFMGINAGMWYLFWALDGPSASGPPFDNRFWIFFRVRRGASMSPRSVADIAAVALPLSSSTHACTHQPYPSLKLVQVLVCLTLFLLANLVTRVISSFVGIKLKRLNHLDRMQDIAKREALLKLLVSKGVEHEVMDPSNHKLWQSLLPRGHSQYKEFPDTDCAVAPDSFSDHAANILAKALCAARKHVLRRPAGPPGAAMDEERGCGLSDRKAPSHRYAVNGGPSADRQAHSTHGRGKPVAHHAALRRPLSSLAKDVVEKHLRSLAKERHFLQPGLKVIWTAFDCNIVAWRVGSEQDCLLGLATLRSSLTFASATLVGRLILACAVLCPLGVPFDELLEQVPYWNTTGGEDGKSTKCTADLCSEKQALILGEIAHDNVLHFLKQQRLAVTHAEARNANMAQPSHMPPSRHGSSGDLAPHAVAGQAAAADAVAAPSPQDSARDSSNPFTKRHLRLFLEAHRAVTVTDAESAADVKYAFDALDVDRTEEVTLENTQEMVCQLYKDRVNLRKTLKGTNAILMKLDMFVGTLLHLIFIFFYMLVFGFTFTSGFFEGFSALLLAVSFIFSSAISNLYENVSFVFLVHPFDVGDILLLNGVRHKVKKVLLSCTHFIDKEGESMEDGFQLLLDLKTVERQPDLLTDLKEELDLYCVLRPSEFDVKTLTEVTFRDITSPMGIVLKADWRYCHKGIDKERCAKARSGMLIHAAKALNELEVQYTWSSDHPGAFIDGTGGSTPGGRSEGVSASRQGVLSGFRTPTAAGAGRVALATARGAPHSSGH